MRNKLGLWCLAYGIDPKVLDEPAVQFPLNDNDPVDTLRAVQSNHYRYVLDPAQGVDADAFRTSAKLEFLGLFRDGV